MSKVSSSANKQIPLIEKGNFCRYLATMIRSGTPILQAIDILSSQTENKALAFILQDIHEDLEKGKTLGDGLAKYPKAFDTVFLTVLNAGEESGTLDKSLDYLGKQLISDYYLIQKVKGAMMYPMVIITAMIGMGFLMMGFVMPRIAKVFLASGFPLPTFTKIIFTVSLFFANYILIIVPVLAGLAMLLVLYFTKGAGRDIILGLLPKMPLVKKIFRDLDIARFGRILGTLLQSGVPIIEAIKIATASLTLPPFKALGAKLESGITKGGSMKEVLMKEQAVFPKMVTGMIAIGEETGALEKVLFDVADFYDTEVETSLRNFTTILEPLIMILVGIGVAIMIFAIITPIYSLVGSFQVGTTR